jgi:hypothetical protein
MRLYFTLLFIAISLRVFSQASNHKKAQQLFENAGPLLKNRIMLKQNGYLKVL